MKDPNTGCPNHCPPACPEGDHICPGGKDTATGCEMPMTCSPKDSFCPTHCPHDHLTCSAPFDDQGKQTGADRCMPMKEPSTGCLNHCPPACPPGDTICPGPKDTAGCEGAPVCGPMGKCPDSGPAPPAPECKNTKSTKWCNKKKNKGKCNKKWVKEKCAKTCGFC